ncbi:hypothetical protein CH063_05664 [Colletotrichum higginsianum]|uniref:Uncharacterized protein n=1 Tax=Colletotrichum higginsianum (strain IMI 349063) TaxID=759273 RepID=H1UZS4_COLHI|nr:hypothetical protein CH063_05664 [Colletotrichum higginsianum]
MERRNGGEERRLFTPQLQATQTGYLSSTHANIGCQRSTTPMRPRNVCGKKLLSYWKACV